jgi:hypothetical protein
VKRKDFQFGIFSSSYVYENFEPKIFNLMRVSSAIVALGASETVLESLSLREKIAEAKRRLDSGTTLAKVMSLIPHETVELFSICKPSTELGKYLSVLSKSKIEHVVFGYPQNYSEETVKTLAHALNNWRKMSGTENLNNVV